MCKRRQLTATFSSSFFSSFLSLRRGGGCDDLDVGRAGGGPDDVADGGRCDDDDVDDDE